MHQALSDAARRLALVALAISGGLATACGVQSDPAGSGSGAPAGAQGAAGVIAFVDSSGCIARVEAATGQSVGSPFCTSSKAGVTSLVWLDADSAAYATAESRALGWQVVNFSTGATAKMDMAEAPRVSIIPPQFYSPRGEDLDIDKSGVVGRMEGESLKRIFPPEGVAPDESTRLVTWSPDADWVLLSTSTDKELWVVGRNGQNPTKLVERSRGVATWFVPSAGAMPHADLTCSVTTAGSFSCQPALRLPADGDSVRRNSGATLDLSWAPCPGATGYEVEIYTGDSVDPAIRRVVAGAFSHHNVDSLPTGTARWRVRALIGPTPAPWSPERTVELV